MPAILPTRYTPPPLPRDLIKRPRLIARLNEGLETGIIGVAGPAGSGKTTLVADWLQQLDSLIAPTGLPLAAVWLTLDATDDDPGILMRDTFLALQQALPDFQISSADPLGIRPSDDIEQWMEGLLESFAALPFHLLLIADGTQWLSNPQFTRALARLKQYMSPNYCFVAVGRELPPVGLAQLRAQGRLTDLDGALLAFTQEEASHLIRNRAGARATEAVCADLWERTEGWATGLVLAGMGLGESADPETYVRDFMTHVEHRIEEYLLDQAYHPQPDVEQRFLCETSILRELTAESCSAVFEGSTPGTCRAMLEDLERKNLFVTPLDSHRRRYRYHQLFREVLQRRLEVNARSEAVTVLHRRAAEHFAAAGPVRDAVQHYLADGDTLAAARLIEHRLADAQEAEAFAELGEWLAMLPRGLIETRPGLLIAQCWTLNWSYRYDRVPALAARAEALLGSCSPDDRDLPAEYWLGQIYAMRSSHLFASDPPHQQLAAAEEALARVAEYSWAHAFVISHMLVRLHEVGRMPDALRIYLELNDRIGLRATPFLTRLQFAMTVLHRRDASPLQELAASRRMLQLAEATGMRGSRTWAHYGLGHAHYAMNQMPEAAQYFSAVLQDAHRGHFEAAMMSAFPLVKIHVEQGALDQADAVVAQARTLVESAGGSAMLEEVDALALFPALARGDKRAARRWLETSTLGTVPVRPYRETVIRAQICLAAGSDGDLVFMIEKLREVLSLARRQHQVQIQIEGSLILARMLWQRGSRQPALDGVEEALVLAAPRNYTRRFIEGGAAVGAMLHELARLGRHAEAALRMLVHIAEAVRLRQPAAALPDPLTERELEVLDLLAQGLTYQEIGNRLGISPITVRNHASHIYGKLGAKGRREAVEAARSFRLL